MVSSQSIDESKWYYSANRFDGMPIPSNIYWDYNNSTTTSTMANYLLSQTFDETKAPELQYNQTDNYYYYELGSYPQSHVSDELNTYLLNNRDSLVQHTSYNNYSYSNLAYEYQGEAYVDAYGRDFYHVEPIVWRLLNIDEYFNNGSTPLVTTINSITGGIAWDNSSWITPIGNWAKNPVIKRWLNENFYNDAFTADEKLFIQNTQIGNGDGTIATDVFLLSRNQINSYLDAKRCDPTSYADMNGAEVTYFTIDVDSVNRVYSILSNGGTVTDNLNDTNRGIRPGLFLSIP